ncbi:MAG: c-type cytochrome [Gammaproteobacteria bacterium]|nr:c-type cytochrome [Gammaproteobacteria bacterium]
MNLRHFPSPIPMLLAVIALGAAVGPAVWADHNSPEALEARIAPAGRLNVLAPGEANAGAAETVSQAPQGAQAVYDSVCAVCHDAGIAGAPRTGDAEAWTARIEQGMAVLVQNAINGYQGAAGVMPARGGNAALSDDEVAASVRYMVEQSQ